MNKNFTLVKKGYDRNEVDMHIRQLEVELAEYREKDAAISSAILNAQIAADEIMRKANVAADTIMHNSRSMSRRLNEKSAAHIAGLIDRVREHRVRLKEFKEDYSALLSKYFLKQDTGDIAVAEMRAIELEGYLQKFLDAELTPEQAQLPGLSAATEPEILQEPQEHGLTPEEKSELLGFGAP